MHSRRDDDRLTAIRAFNRFARVRVFDLKIYAAMWTTEVHSGVEIVD
jgi:hypothetical protein